MMARPGQLRPLKLGPSLQIFCSTRPAVSGRQGKAWSAQQKLCFVSFGNMGGRTYWPGHGLTTAWVPCEYFDQECQYYVAAGAACSQ